MKGKKKTRFDELDVGFDIRCLPLKTKEQGEEEKNAIQSIFDVGGFNNDFANESSEDFELISFYC